MYRGEADNISEEGCWGWSGQAGGLEEDHVDVEQEDMKVIGEREGEEKNTVRWRQMFCCGEPWKENLIRKEEEAVFVSVAVNANAHLCFLAQMYVMCVNYGSDAPEFSCLQFL